jgi:hypothetical protein
METKGSQLVWEIISKTLSQNKPAVVAHACGPTQEAEVGESWLET